MIERLLLRCSSTDGPDVHVACELARDEIVVTVTIDGLPGEYRVPRARLQPALDALGAARVPPVPVLGPLERAAAFELTVAGQLAESMYRWVSTPPEGWRPLHDAAQALLALAGELTAR